MRTLSELGVERDRIIFVLNKSDLASNYEINEQDKKLLNFEMKIKNVLQYQHWLKKI